MSQLAQALKGLISARKIETQEEIRDHLKRSGLDVDQSTISRTLRRLGVTKIPDSEGRLVYRWPPKKISVPPSRSMAMLVKSIMSNEQLIILHTDPGSAALVARFLDVQRPEGLLGTIAGDDTVLAVPAGQAHLPALLTAIRDAFPQSRS